MSGNKRYYWLKLEEKFFEDDTIQWLEEQKNGKDYVIFYLKLMLKSLQDDGSLIRYVGEKLIPYDVPALAKLTATNEDTVAVAMRTFVEIGLVEMRDSGEIYMSQITEMVGSETHYAVQKRRQRAVENNKKQLNGQCPDNVKECPPEIELERDIEIESPDSTNVKYDDDSPYLGLAKHLFTKVKENNSKAREPNFQNWADDIRKLVEIDGNTVEEVKEVIDWCQSDSFWKNNVMSANKLRNQFPKLWGQGGFENKGSIGIEDLWGD